MTRTMVGALLLSAFLVSSGWADTVTFRNNAELNGVVRYRNDDFTVTARYKNGTRTNTFHRAEVRSVEINARDFNPGEPPTDISVFEDRTAATRPGSNSQSSQKTGSDSGDAASQGNQHGRRKVLDPDEPNPSTTDLIWLRDKSELFGRLVSIESGQLTVANKKGKKKLKVKDVMTILVAPD